MPLSITLPAYMTPHPIAELWETTAAIVTDINSTEFPLARALCLSNRSTCSWTVTSSASGRLIGNNQFGGSQEKASAIITRWRMPRRTARTDNVP